MVGAGEKLWGAEGGVGGAEGGKGVGACSEGGEKKWVIRRWEVGTVVDTRKGPRCRMKEVVAGG